MTANTRTPARLRVLTAVLFGIYLVLLVAIILFKFPFQYQLTASGRVLNLIPFAGSYSDPRGLATGAVIENVLIFIPLGLDLAMLKRDWSFGRITLVAAGTSVAFEVIQFLFAIGRSDVTDVICNTLGGVIGVGLYYVLAKILRSRTTLALTVIQLIVTVLALAFFTFLRLHSR